MTLEGKRAELADLYYESGSVQFGAFKLAAHKKDPTLPDSPIYLHYPKKGAGVKLLPRIYVLVGAIAHEIVSDLGLGFKRIGAVPEGAKPLASDLAARFNAWPNNLIEFGKDEVEGQNHFFWKSGEYEPGDVMLAVEDHTSGGYNKGLFIAGANEIDLIINDFLTVVDREQGAASYLASIGVGFHSIFKLSELLEYYWLVKRCISLSKFGEISDYIATNQLWTPAA